MSVFSLPEPEIGICDCGQQAHIAYKGKGETLEKVISVTNAVRISPPVSMW